MKRETLGRVLAIVGAPWAVLALGCGQRLVLGTNAAALTDVDAAIVGTQASAVDVPACDPGTAHPNVCCQTGSDGIPRCSVYDGNPFLPCPAPWATYPDPRSCCQLDAPDQCEQAPASVPALGAGCTYACPPGYYATQPITATSGACCSVTGFAGGSCFAWASASASPDADAGPPVVQGPACDLPCPSGWEAVAATPESSELCCQGDAGTAARECFSPATGAAYVPTPPLVDAGPPPAVEAGSPPAVDASSLRCDVTEAGGCYCVWAADSNAYGLKCDESECVCLRNDTVVATAPSACPADAGASVVPALRAIWTGTCGFPN